jgi:phage shock protein E
MRDRKTEDLKREKETNKMKLVKRLWIRLVEQIDFFRFATDRFSLVLTRVRRSGRPLSSPAEGRPQANHQDLFITLVNDARSRITEISPMELAKKKLLPVIIDVREEEEYLSGHISEAKHISRGLLEKRIGQVASDLTTPILVYCPRGNSGALAADSLQKMGYKTVYSLKGGLQQWLEGGGVVECVPLAQNRCRQY